MSYFIFKGIIELQKPFLLSGKDAEHIFKSRRIRTGETLEVQDIEQTRYLARVEKTGKNEITLIALQYLKIPPVSAFQIHLYQALVKEKAVDFIIQKTTELGVNSICLFESRYSQRLKPGPDIRKKQIRWQRIALEACKQSGRVEPPEIIFLPILPEFQQFLPDSSIKTIPTICLSSEGGTIALDSLLFQEQDLNLLVGPEGGWHAEELDAIEGEKVHLGPRILRSDTTAVTAVSILQYLFGDLNKSPLQSKK